MHPLSIKTRQVTFMQFSTKMHSQQWFKMWITLLVLLTPLVTALPAGYTEDDMRLTGEQLRILTDNTAIKGRNAMAWPKYYWPDRTLVYSISSIFTSSEVSLIERAMAEIAAISCVRFRRAASVLEPQAVIQRGNGGCSSSVGYQGRRQDLNLGTGCMYSGIIKHELLHTLAFLHMQSDPTRDDFVRIVYENITPGKEGNFAKYNAQYVNDLGLGYDYGSIMHYGAYDFSSNGKPTIVTLQANAKIGQRKELSEKDIKKLNLIYCTK